MALDPLICGVYAYNLDSLPLSLLKKIKFITINKQLKMVNYSWNVSDISERRDCTFEPCRSALVTPPLVWWQRISSFLTFTPTGPEPVQGRSAQSSDRMTLTLPVEGNTSMLLAGVNPTQQSMDSDNINLVYLIWKENTLVLIFMHDSFI